MSTIHPDGSDQPTMHSLIPRWATWLLYIIVFAQGTMLLVYMVSVRSLYLTLDPSGVGTDDRHHMKMSSLRNRLGLHADSEHLSAETKFPLADAGRDADHTHTKSYKSRTRPSPEVEDEDDVPESTESYTGTESATLSAHAGHQGRGGSRTRTQTHKSRIESSSVDRDGPRDSTNNDSARTEPSFGKEEDVRKTYSHSARTKPSSEDGDDLSDSRESSSATFSESSAKAKNSGTELEQSTDTHDESSPSADEPEQYKPNGRVRDRILAGKRSKHASSDQCASSPQEIRIVPMHKVQPGAFAELLPEKLKSMPNAAVLNGLVQLSQQDVEMMLDYYDHSGYSRKGYIRAQAQWVQHTEDTISSLLTGDPALDEHYMEPGESLRSAALKLSSMFVNTSTDWMNFQESMPSVLVMYNVRFDKDADVNDCQVYLMIGRYRLKWVPDLTEHHMMCTSTNATNAVKRYEVVVVFRLTKHKQYFHFLYESLTRVALVLDHVEYDPRIKVVVDGYKKNMELMLNYLGIDLQRLVIIADQSACADVAIIPDLTMARGTHIATQHITRAVFVQNMGFDFEPRNMSQAGYVIFIMRTVAHNYEAEQEPSRYVINEKEVYDALLARAREADVKLKVHTGLNVRLAKQFQLFRDSMGVIGPHGAAFTHILFMRQDAFVIEFMQSELPNSCYRDMAMRFLIRYRHLRIPHTSLTSTMTVNATAVAKLMAEEIDYFQKRRVHY